MEISASHVRSLGALFNGLEREHSDAINERQDQWKQIQTLTVSDVITLKARELRSAMGGVYLAYKSLPLRDFAVKCLRKAASVVQKNLKALTAFNKSTFLCLGLTPFVYKTLC
jgi:hypothetical protein